MMNKIFCRSFKSPWAILYFASVIIMFYYYKGYNIPIEVWIMNTHYIPVYLNTAFIIFSIRKARDYESVHVQSIIRLGRLKYVTELIKSGIYNVIFYLLINGLFFVLYMLNYLYLEEYKYIRIILVCRDYSIFIN